jgi:hypothetical protein
MNDDIAIYKDINRNSDLLLSTNIIHKFNKIAKKSSVRTVFTRFPYYTSKKTCKSLGSKHNQGNCVAFAYNIKKRLKCMKFKSYIIGAKPPMIYSRPGYKEISHAAVILQYKDGLVLFDSAFYFHKAIILKYDETPFVLQLNNVYSNNTQKWTFVLKDDFIFVYIDDIYTESYYYIKELLNPSLSITKHTNLSDLSVFRCEIDKNLLLKFYYNLNFNNNINTLSVMSNIMTKTYVSIFDFFYDSNFDCKLFKTWCYSLPLLKSQKQKLYRDVCLFFMNKQNKKMYSS